MLCFMFAFLRQSFVRLRLEVHSCFRSPLQRARFLPLRYWCGHPITHPNKKPYEFEKLVHKKTFPGKEKSARSLSGSAFTRASAESTGAASPLWPSTAVRTVCSPACIRFFSPACTAPSSSGSCFSTCYSSCSVSDCSATACLHCYLTTDGIPTWPSSLGIWAGRPEGQITASGPAAALLAVLCHLGTRRPTMPQHLPGLFDWPRLAHTRSEKCQKGVSGAGRSQLLAWSCSSFPDPPAPGSTIPAPGSLVPLAQEHAPQPCHNPAT